METGPKLQYKCGGYHIRQPSFDYCSVDRPDAYHSRQEFQHFIYFKLNNQEERKFCLHSEKRRFTLADRK